LDQIDCDKERKGFERAYKYWADNYSKCEKIRRDNFEKLKKLRIMTKFLTEIEQSRV
jgi:hypothetical protein